MAATPYQGHTSYGAFKAAATNPDDVAPADRPDYDIADFANQPGAAARANGYPQNTQSGGSAR